LAIKEKLEFRRKIQTKEFSGVINKMKDSVDESESILNEYDKRLKIYSKNFKDPRVMESYQALKKDFWQKHNVDHIQRSAKETHTQKLNPKYQAAETNGDTWKFTFLKFGRQKTKIPNRFVD